MKILILEHEHLLPDISTRTDKIYHDVDIEGSKQIKQHSFRMSPVKCSTSDINFSDFIGTSQSDRNSPCILVTKPDGTFHMGTDYRNVNSVTNTDLFPVPRVDDCIGNVGHAKDVTKLIL